MYRNNNRLTSIAISRENYARLKDLGKAGDSFNDVINGMLEKIEARGTVKSNK